MNPVPVTKRPESVLWETGSGIQPDAVAEGPRVLERRPRVGKPGEFGAPDDHLVSLVAPDSVESEHYRTVRYAVERMHRPPRGTLIGICSPSPLDGKTLTALNLSGSLSQDENVRVLVVDADLRNPSIGRFLRMKETGPGLSGALVRADCALETVIRRHPHYNLAILPAGTSTTAPYELFKSARMGSLLEEARAIFDYVCLDMAPMMFPEARLLEQHLDSFLIVVAAHRTKRKALEAALEMLDSSKVLGLLFNRDTQQRTQIPSYYPRRTQ
jgi:capsular exopolysaccharide synthesis family protein